ncbi:hypothetical protein [Halospeciosus flavus]|uniref:DUF1102 domain-containing protein n=1 Tax=Halospeciosus flavus TaxID=3032283 RepID=A0ABD5Z6E4_9EURY|nr:hypothetical protein [Halospeciosus flavus]
MQLVSRGAVIVTVSVIVLVTLASGPVISSINLTTNQSDTASFDDGNITVTDVTIPNDSYTFHQGNYGSAAYYLETPDTTLTLKSVTGSPRLVYKLRIPAKSYVVAKTTFIRNNATGQFSLTGPSDTFKPSTINQSEYRGKVTILVRSGMESRVLATKNVTIEVSR